MIEQLLKKIKDKAGLHARNRMISTAESCTGGLLSSYLTSISGSSEYFHSSVVSYSNEAKISILGVKPETLSQFGAVSEQVAVEMAEGMMKISNTDISVSITGIAGPGGGSATKPVGMVCLGFVYKQNDEIKGEVKKIDSFTKYFLGSRDEIREKTCIFALELILRSYSGVC